MTLTSHGPVTFGLLHVIMQCVFTVNILSLGLESIASKSSRLNQDGRPLIPCRLRRSTKQRGQLPSFLSSETEPQLTHGMASKLDHGSFHRFK